jgi:hypothetical protein
MPAAHAGKLLVRAMPRLHRRLEDGLPEWRLAGLKITAAA